jgi:hypothetical protein
LAFESFVHPDQGLQPEELASEEDEQERDRFS